MGMNLWHVERWPTESVGYIHPSSSSFRKSIISFQRGDRVNRSVVNGTGLHSIRGRSWASCAADGSGNHETFPLDRKDDPSYDRVETSKKKDVLESIKCERMLQKLIDWHRRYYSTIVPRNAPDAAELSEWVAEGVSFAMNFCEAKAMLWMQPNMISIVHRYKESIILSFIWPYYNIFCSV